MDHIHHKEHDHAAVLHKVNASFVIGISLNFLFVIIEAFVGFTSQSLSLLSDAGHNLADVASLALSLLGLRLMKVKTNKQYTYGYRKTSVLVALFNSFVLLLSIGAITYEAVHRIFQPVSIPGKTIMLMAGVGILVNGISAMLFLRHKDHDLNVKSAYLHLLNDAIVSFAIVVGGFMIFYSGWFWIDSALSIIVAMVILFSTWRLLRESLRLTLDGVPDNINIDEIRSVAMKMNGVKGIHHIHIWALSTTENAMTAHLVLQQGISIEQEQRIKHHLKHDFEKTNIHHITLETERENENCETTEC